MGKLSLLFSQKKTTEYQNYINLTMPIFLGLTVRQSPMQAVEYTSTELNYNTITMKANESLLVTLHRYYCVEKTERFFLALIMKMAVRCERRMPIQR
jgi:hypothetical protein